MAKTIKLTDKEGKEYVLEFSRKTVEDMEREGFVITDIQSKPLTMLPKLFAGAFKKNHRFADKKVIKEMLDNIVNKEEFIEKLSEMYSDPILTLFDEPEENMEGNIHWTASW